MLCLGTAIISEVAPRMSATCPCYEIELNKEINVQRQGRGSQQIIWERTMRSMNDAECRGGGEIPTEFLRYARTWFAVSARPIVPISTPSTLKGACAVMFPRIVFLRTVPTCYVTTPHSTPIVHIIFLPIALMLILVEMFAC